MEKIVSLAKRRGFVFQSSEIYGGLNGFWDYGPIGVELRKNIKDCWWRQVVQERDDVVGLDTSIVAHPQTWVASGHVENFTDPMVDCKKCHRRFRTDEISKKTCPECGGSLTEARKFNLMFKTHVGAVEEDSSIAYLRPETCQSIFTQFKNVVVTSRQKIPFGIAQIGKSFRNEITPRNFIFRSREFEQMEMEFFVKASESAHWYEYWVEERFRWFLALGVRKEKLRKRVHAKEELAHYAKGCTDIEYEFPFGWSELEGIADRGDWDLSQHMKVSGKDLSYFDEETKEKFTPCVVESSVGVDRTFLTILADAYHEEMARTGEGGEEARVVLRFSPRVAPYKVALFPLSKKLGGPVRKLAHELRRHLATDYDEVGSIGKRYRRHDEIGTPYCLTYDFDSEKDQKVTLRDRDTMKQERIEISQVRDYLEDQLKEGV
ncbi:MAG: glycine--tRNA ligase [Deltaproteobacteria bacterium]|nr:glycine--tRNA ligase [Deltaproteobacteria bacterium]